MIEWVPGKIRRFYQRMGDMPPPPPGTPPTPEVRLVTHDEHHQLKQANERYRQEVEHLRAALTEIERRSMSGAVKAMAHDALRPRNR